MRNRNQWSIRRMAIAFVMVAGVATQAVAVGARSL